MTAARSVLQHWSVVTLHCSSVRSSCCVNGATTQVAGKQNTVIEPRAKSTVGPRIGLQTIRTRDLQHWQVVVVQVAGAGSRIELVEAYSHAGILFKKPKSGRFADTRARPGDQNASITPINHHLVTAEVGCSLQRSRAYCSQVTYVKCEFLYGIIANAEMPIFCEPLLPS